MGMGQSGFSVTRQHSIEHVELPTFLFPFIRNYAYLTDKSVAISKASIPRKHLPRSILVRHARFSRDM